MTLADDVDAFRNALRRFGMSLWDLGVPTLWGSGAENVIGFEACRVYWGSHGCDLPRGHDGTCVCGCAFMEDEPGINNVGQAPYYGPDTKFYGEDAAARGLPLQNGDRD